MKDNQGPLLEGKVFRICLAQGVFAERGLQPAASSDAKLIATDVDILTSEYGPGFHLSRRHYECKSGDISVLDRLLWLRGLRELLGADSSYLVAKDFDLEVIRFGRRIKVDVMSESNLLELEAALDVNTSIWPCRSDFELYDAAQKLWSQRRKAEPEKWRVVQQALLWVQVFSWPEFSFGRLSRLLRTLEELPATFDHGDPQLTAATTYVLQASMVRFTQYLLAMCGEVSKLPYTERRKHIKEKLTFGGTEGQFELIRSVVSWTKSALNHKGIDLPSEVNADRFAIAPTFTEDLCDLVQELIKLGMQTCHLCIAAELDLFGSAGCAAFPRLTESAARAGGTWMLVVGFIRRNFALPVDCFQRQADTLKGLLKPEAAPSAPAPTESASGSKRKRR